MSDTIYGTDKEKVDDAMMRIERIMRLRGISGHVVIASGKESKDLFRLADESFITHNKDARSMLFIVEMNLKKINPVAAMKTIEEFSSIGEKSSKIGLAIEKFMEAFAGQLKKKFS